MLSCLDRYLSGNTSAIQPVRIPTENEERERSIERQRQGLKQEQVRIGAKASSLARYYGYTLPSTWWKPKRFPKTMEDYPDYLVDLLSVWQRIMVSLEVELKERTKELEQASARELPVGLGALTATVLDREVCDWNRFKNRRQVSSYTGLVPREFSSGSTIVQGSITKHGNPRIRHALLEAVWRLFRYQPEYVVITKWKERMLNDSMSKARKKKMAVAIARQFAVDWWRIQTGRVKAEDLGLKLSLPLADSLRGWRNNQLANEANN